jgi:hypothetical protein
MPEMRLAQRPVLGVRVQSGARHRPEDRFVSSGSAPPDGARGEGVTCGGCPGYVRRQGVRRPGLRSIAGITRTRGRAMRWLSVLPWPPTGLADGFGRG